MKPFMLIFRLHRDQHRCWLFFPSRGDSCHFQHEVGLATPSLRQMLLIVHIERPAPDAFLPLMSEWNAMFTYLSWMFSTVVLPGPAVP